VSRGSWGEYCGWLGIDLVLVLRKTDVADCNTLEMDDLDEWRRAWVLPCNGVSGGVVPDTAVTPVPIVSMVPIVPIVPIVDWWTNPGCCTKAP
jgi:hypothetical protein